MPVCFLVLMVPSQPCRAGREGRCLAIRMRTGQYGRESMATGMPSAPGATSRSITTSEQARNPHQGQPRSWTGQGFRGVACGAGTRTESRVCRASAAGRYPGCAGLRGPWGSPGAARDGRCRQDPARRRVRPPACRRIRHRLVGRYRAGGTDRGAVRGAGPGTQMCASWFTAVSGPAGCLDDAPGAATMAADLR